MTKLLYSAALLLALAAGAKAQTYPGQFPAGSLFGNPNSTAGIGQALSSGSWSVPVLPDTFCAVDRTGASDMGACINSAITSASNCGVGGNATVKLRAGTYLVTTPIVPKSCVSLEGDGSGRTILLTNSAAPFAQASGNQLVHFRLKGVTFKDSGTHASATVMTFTSIMGSIIEDIEFGGYTTGTLMSIAGAVNSSFSDTSGIWNTSNSIFNNFRQWTARDGCGKCIMMAGVYGGTPTGSPANSSNVPSVVATLNQFEDFRLWGVTTIGFDLIKAVDTIYIRRSVITFNTNGAIGVQIGDDNANFPGNNYVNSLRAELTFSQLGGVTGLTLFRAGDWTADNQAEIDTDIPLASMTLVSAQASVTMAKFDICGHNAIASFVDTLGFNTNRSCLSYDYGTGTQGQSTYYRVNNGSAANPIWGFVADSANGIYLPAAGVLGFSKGISAGSNGGTGGSLTLNGATSGNCPITVAATLGTANLCGVATVDISGNISANSTSVSAIISTAPATLTGTSGSTTSTSQIINSSGTFTLTLPSAAASGGRWLYIKNIVSSNAVNSAGSNVVPQGSATAGTAILAASASKWAILQSDGSNWIIMASN